MRWSVGIVLIVSIAGMLPAARLSAHVPSVSNPTLQKTLQAVSPDMTGHALSALCIRTFYQPQTIPPDGETHDLTVTRTTISELVVNSACVRESVCDARQAKDRVRQYAFYYANDNKRVRIYDSKNKRGFTRTSPYMTSNYLALVTCPALSAYSGRFVSRGVPVFLARLTDALVTSETPGTTGKFNTITLKGEYVNSDPEKTFIITVVPEYNYQILALTESDSNGRVLAEMQVDDLVPVDSQLSLPTLTRFRRHTYGTHDGHTVQSHEVRVLDPKIIPVDETTFSLAFPSGAKVVDLTSNIDLGALRSAADNAVQDAMRGIGGFQIPSDSKGQAIVERARAAYARENADAAQGDPQKPEYTLKMPRSPSPERWPGILTLGLALVMTAITVLALRKRHPRSHFAPEPGQKGDAA